MAARIKSWLAPPVMQDPDMARRAALINWVMLFVLLALIMLLLITPWHELRQSITWGTFGVFFGMLLACKVALNRGWLRLVIQALIVVPWIVLIGLAVMQNGIFNSSLFTFLPLLLAAGLLAGRREALILMAASALVLVVLALGQSAGWLPLQMVSVSPETVAARYIVNLFLSGLILTLSAGITEKAFETLREELRLRQEFQASVLRQANELALLHNVRTALSKHSDLPNLIESVVEAIRETFGYTLVSLYLLEGDVLKLQHQVGYETTISEIPLAKGVCGRVVRTGQTVFLPDVRTDPEFLGAQEFLTSEICVPLVTAGNVAGVLNVESQRGVALDERDRVLVEALGEHVSLALERARILNQLQRSEERYRAVSELTSDYAFLLRRQEDGSFRFEWVTEAYERVTGYSLEEANELGDPANLILPADAAEAARLKAELAEGETASGEYRIRTKSDEVRWIRSANRPVFEGGEWVGILGAARDVTWDVEAELAVRASEYRYRALFEQTNDAVFIIGLDEKILQVNRRATELMGYSSEEMLGCFADEFLVPEERESGRQRFSDLLEKNSLPMYERTFVRKDGSQMPAEINVGLVRDPEGNPLHIQSVVRDISERKRAERRLLEERNLLLGLINAVPDGLYAKDRDSRFIIANQAVTEGYRLERQEAIVGLHDRDFIDSALAERYHVEEAQVMETGQPVINKEETWLGADGKRLWSLTSKVPLRNSDGDIVGTVGATRLITDVKSAEQALRESEYRFRSVFEQSYDGILITGVDGTRIAVNARAAEQLGYSIAELMELPKNVAVAPEEKAAADKNWARILTGERLPTYERTAVKRNGERIILEMNVSLVRDEAGEPLFVQTIARDVTERRVQEQEREQLVADLQRQSNRLQTAVEIAASTIAILQPEKLIQDAVNLIAERFEFYYVGLFLVDDARAYAVLAAGSGQIGAEMLAAGHRLRVGGESMIGWCTDNKRARIALDVGEDAVHFENPALPATRSEMALPLISRGEVLGALTVQSEVEAAFTEDDIAALQAMSDQLAGAIENARLYEESRLELKRRERAEAAVRKLNKELEQRVEKRTAQLQVANKELESFAYTVSHDLRAPLRAIGGYAGILLEDYSETLAGQPAHYLTQIRANIDRMGLLIDGLLAFSRLGRQQLKRQPVELRSLVLSVMEDLKEETRGRKVALKVSDLPIVQADPMLIRQVFANLLGNAVKFTRGRKKAEIEVGIVERTDEEIYFVKDNGVGFDLKYVDKLFGVFQRLHPAHEYEGTGVGLAIVQRIVSRHGGRVWVEAGENQGATFFFTLGVDGGDDGTAG